MSRYAEGTTVAVDKTIADMRRLLEQAGSSHWAHGSSPENDVVQFSMEGRHYRFSVERPSADDLRNAYIAEATGYEWTVKQRADRIDWKARVDAEWRRRWRARLMWLKAQIEFIDEVPLDQSLLANLVLPDGRTFGGWAQPQIEAMYAEGDMPPLLGAGR